MHAVIQYSSRKSILRRIPPKQEGISLVLFVVALVIVSGTLMATTTRAWLGYKGAIRQGQARSARELAEAGSSRLIAELNKNHSHLLVIDKGYWATAKSITGICSNDSTGVPAMEDVPIGEGRYSLQNYTFHGTPFFGGTGIIRVKGELLSGNTPVSTSIIEQSIQIVPRTCESFDTSNATPGLIALSNIDLGNNDIEGTNAGIICIRCNESANNNGCVDSDTPVQDFSQNNKECMVGKGPQSTIDGGIYIGPATVPPLPLRDNLAGVNPISITTSRTIKSGNGSTLPELLDGSCVNVDGWTDCLVSSIDLSGTKQLQVDTSSGTPVRIFVTGDITLNGRSQINHTTGSSQAAMVGLFGNHSNDDDGDDQTITLSGRSKMYNVLVNFPDANVGINGGGNVDNIYGSVVAKSWSGSSSNKANIIVPPDMAEGIESIYGTTLAITDYAAMGPVKWSTLITE